MKKAVIFAPFWGQIGHVGNNRVDRFIRWLAVDGYHVVLVCAGSVFGQREEQWGTEITVRDPIGLFRNASSTGVRPPGRKPNKLRRALAYWFFNPDPGVIWSRVAARNSLVLKTVTDAAFIISSSPPESAHIGAWQLSRRLGVPHVVDMRDGWLDEPMKPMLHRSLVRRWLEGRMEARILRDAKAIQVTSVVWKYLLCNRYPKLEHKVHVLTNGYPNYKPVPLSNQPKKPREDRLLIHAGRFTGSRLTQLPDILLSSLLTNLSIHESKGVIRLIGRLSKEELTMIEPFKSQFLEIGWRIECPGFMPRGELLDLLPQADGLLLLSATYAALPSKLFEYISTGRPIFVVTELGSATWNICKSLPQAYLLKTGDVGQNGSCMEKPFYMLNEMRAPNEFSEEYLKDRFVDVISAFH